MKKFFVFVRYISAIATMLLLPISPAYASASTAVEENTQVWYDSIVDNMLDRNIITDKEGLNNYLTRGELSKILLSTNSVFKRSSVVINPFVDLPRNNKYCNYILHLYHSNVYEGIIDDNGNRLAETDSFLTREQAASFIVRAFNLTDYEDKDLSLNYNDADFVSEYAINDILICQKLNLISGYPDGSFKPKSYITKIEFLSIVNKVFELGLEANAGNKPFYTTFDGKYKSSNILVEATVDNSEKGEYILNLKFKNTSNEDYNYGFGGYFQIERKVGERWVVVPFDKNGDIDDSLKGLKGNTTRDEIIDLNYYYNNIEKGQYRIIFITYKNIDTTYVLYLNEEYADAVFYI